MFYKSKYPHDWPGHIARIKSPVLLNNIRFYHKIVPLINIINFEKIQAFELMHYANFCYYIMENVVTHCYSFYMSEFAHQMFGEHSTYINLTYISFTSTYINFIYIFYLY